MNRQTAGGLVVTLVEKTSQQYSRLSPFKKLLQLTVLCITTTSLSLAQAYDSPEIEEWDYLPSLGVSSTKTSVSGISSGAFMASQLHVAFSGQIMGVGMVAGGPYLCVGKPTDLLPYSMIKGARAMKAMSSCMNPCMMWDILSGINDYVNPKLCEAFVPSSLAPDIQHGLDVAKTDKNIDSIDNLKDDNVYLFTGKSDFVVATSVVSAARDFYQAADVKSIRFSDDKVNAGHSFVTHKPGHTSCAYTALPFINTCKNLNQALDLLTTIYGDLLAPVNDPYSQGKLYSFDQSRYFDDLDKIGMSDTGYVYIPNNCTNKDADCALHIALHGCLQSEDMMMRSQFVSQAGYNEVAVANDMVILYPQAKTYNFFHLNPMGCWDFWGYTGKNFYNKKGLQMRSIMAMVAGITGDGENLASK